MSATQDKKYLTPTGRSLAEKELKSLIEEKRPLNAQRIQVAKDLGDLSENAEYAEAKNEQAFTEARIADLTYLLKFAEVVEEPVRKDVVVVGTTVTVDEDMTQKKYAIVGYNEANPQEGKISNESPLGHSLLGRQVGETVVLTIPKGEKKITILKIE